MHRVTTVILSVICVALLGVATNVATGALPDRWSPYLWLAWPLLILLVLALVVVEILRAREPEQITAAGAARRVLLERVRRYWVTSVLERSLHEEARIELGIAATADDRRHPWALETSNRDGFTGTLDHQTAMSTLFDRLDRAVVILGAPGAGKTTTLLELARDLLDRAEADPDAPIPVVLNLSSWATHRRPLSRWLAEQLGERYGIPSAQATAWVDTDEILPLLDGLDEVADEHRDACAAAIADFHARQPLTAIAVCCRQVEYGRLNRPLPVYGTVSIRPLDRAQVERYVARPELVGLRDALTADPGLWQLADSPLLLSIMALAYLDSHDEWIAAAAPLGGTGRERLFARYVDTMLRRRPHRRYPPEMTRSYLASLARELSHREQTLFVLDMIDESWSPRYRRLHRASRIAPAAVVACLALVFPPIGWWFSGWPGLVAAVGVVALIPTLALVSSVYDNLLNLSIATGRDRSRETYGWFVGSLINLLLVFVDERAGVVGIGTLAVAVGALGTGLDADGPTLAMGIAYGAGFLVAALVTFAACGSAQVALFFRPATLRADRHELPSPLLRQRLGFVLPGLVPLGVAAGVLAGTIVAVPADATRGARFGAVLGTGAMLVVLVVVALGPMAEQLLVRRRLARQEVLPYPLLPFLTHAVQCLFLRQVGDGYIFVHRELLDHFAAGVPDGNDSDRAGAHPGVPATSAEGTTG
ncbi:NACHT domain-containing protein [Micromonospora phytophila]|uniref:NACHT domain-containing protein n=1 Tax=Micromonospora phytophila TaxID=709888 RepID=UPI00202F53DD|nr:NACHT domain-containing protein [Micromonospora phytophila]MCM0677501.1 NACHT domain-containing protein [Micromonospora phytophila]